MSDDLMCAVYGLGILIAWGLISLFLTWIL